jgi:hypothetical protein
MSYAACPQVKVNAESGMVTATVQLHGDGGDNMSSVSRTLTGEASHAGGMICAGTPQTDSHAPTTSPEAPNARRVWLGYAGAHVYCYRIRSGHDNDGGNDWAGMAPGELVVVETVGMTVVQRRMDAFGRRRAGSTPKRSSLIAPTARTAACCAPTTSSSTDASATIAPEQEQARTRAPDAAAAGVHADTQSETRRAALGSAAPLSTAAAAASKLPDATPPTPADVQWAKSDIESDTLPPLPSSCRRSLDCSNAAERLATLEDYGTAEGLRADAPRAANEQAEHAEQVNTGSGSGLGVVVMLSDGRLLYTISRAATADGVALVVDW